MQVTASLELVDADTIHRGIMVALYLEPKLADALAVPGGEPPEQLHITLAYLGKTDDPPAANEEQVLEFLRSFASSRPVLQGEIAGRGLFKDTGDGAPFILLPDLPGLPALRDDLVEGLSTIGAPPNTAHGFTPHITLRYLQKGDEIPQTDAEGESLRFSSITLSWGDSMTVVPLGGGTQEFGDSPGHPFHGNQFTGGVGELIDRLNAVKEGRVDPAPHNTEANQSFLQNQLIRTMADWRDGRTSVPAVRKIAEEALQHPNAEVRQIAQALLQATHELAAAQPLEFGDSPGHEFRGNQWTDAMYGTVYNVPTEKAWELRSYDATGGMPKLDQHLPGPEHWDRLMRDIKAAGKVETPIEINKSAATGKTSVWDGNHRTAIAHALGLRTVPATMPKSVADELGLKPAPRRAEY